mmetsp:Transcript_110025/g.296071  ORF Transcript_110025/g.296071 Transcript_110025/m.296071 type:complete len:88 (+) Transcript_110025:74-337(+)
MGLRDAWARCVGEANHKKPPELLDKICRYTLKEQRSPSSEEIDWETDVLETEALKHSRPGMILSVISGKNTRPILKPRLDTTVCSTT